MLPIDSRFKINRRAFISYCMLSLCGLLFPGRTGFGSKRNLNQQITDEQLSNRITSIPPLFCTAYITPDAPGQEGQESLVAKYPLALVPQDHRMHFRKWRDRVKRIHPEIVLLGYQIVIEETTVPGPGHDELRKIVNSWATYPNGFVPTVGPLSKRRRIFDPRTEEWQEGFLTACQATLASYPYEGLFLDQCTIFRKSHPSRQEKVKMEVALQKALVELRKEFPNKLFVGNCRDNWQGLNGEMVEGRKASPEELRRISGHILPKLDLFASRLMHDNDIATVKRDMTFAHANHAFYGASVDYQHVLWFDIFDEVVDKNKRY